MREELVSGAHGVEGRYPFLDPKVVQEFLWLSAEVKNSEYKRPIADLFRKHNYPIEFGTKKGFAVIRNITTWKKIQRQRYKFGSQVEHLPDLVPQRPRRGGRVMS